MAPPFRYLRSREKTPSEKAWTSLGIRTLELNVPPGWLLGVSPPHYIIGRARADTLTRTHPHTPPHCILGRARPDGHSLTHPPTYAFADSSKPSNCRFQNCGIPLRSSIPVQHSRDPGFSLILGRVSTFTLGWEGKASVCNAGDPGSIPGLGRDPGEGNGNPLQYFCLENPMDRGAW